VSKQRRIKTLLLEYNGDTCWCTAEELSWRLEKRMRSGSVRWVCETFQRGLLFNGENKANVFHQNFDELLSDYTALHPRRWPFSYFLQLEGPMSKKKS
jgi:hypothetical protein